MDRYITSSQVLLLSQQHIFSLKQMRAQGTYSRHSQFWPLAARLGMFAVVGLLIALCLPNLRGASKVKHIRSISYTVSAVLAVSVITAFVSAFSPIWLVKPTTKPAIAADYKPENEPDQWVGFGRTPAGEQFAPYSQINAENVKNLEVAWTFHTSDITGNGSENQNTPLQIFIPAHRPTKSLPCVATRAKSFGILTQG